MRRITTFDLRRRTLIVASFSTSSCTLDTDDDTAAATAIDNNDSDVPSWRWRRNGLLCCGCGIIIDIVSSRLCRRASGNPRHTTQHFLDLPQGPQGGHIDIFSPNRQCKQPCRQYPPQSTIARRMVPLGAPYRRRDGTELHVLAAAFPPDEIQKTSG